MLPLLFVSAEENQVDICHLTAHADIQDINLGRKTAGKLSFLACDLVK